MKKTIIVLGAIAIVSLLISTATALPQVHSEPVMKLVNEVEQKNAFFEDKLEGFSEKLTLDVEPQGIIDTIIAIIQFIIELIMEIIQFIADLMQLGSIIMSLIDAIENLIAIITQFIEWIMGIFSPGTFATTA